jgi:tetratricopeptide (TPR) repeat protein
MDSQPVASTSFEIRSDELRIIERLRELEKAAENPGSHVTFHKDFGQELFHQVFSGELGCCWQELMQISQKGGMRISLQFDDSAQDLADLPWEFLHDGSDFLVARPKTLLSRLPAGLVRVVSVPLESALHMLVVISAPSGLGCAPLDTEKERDRIMQAVDRLYAERKLEVDFTDDATFETIQSYLNEKDYHIVHFTGHGVEKDGQGYIALENDDLSVRMVGNQAVADLFARQGIRLVVLNACQSDDLADRLTRLGVPAVVAMQYSILDSSATRFAYSFYQALASGKAVDQSLTEARLAMRNAKDGNNVDFATPVLYLLDPHCMRIDSIRQEATGLLNKPVMLGEVSVMKEGFVGRQKELRFLQNAILSAGKRAIIIHGWGGIGKTVLASRLALRLDQHFEGFYGHKCNPQTRAEDILNGLNGFLSMAGISALNQVLYSPAPMSVKTAVLTSILNQKRFLIILDNFESCLDESRKQIANPELRQFVEALLNGTFSGTKYIITTRYDFDPLAGRLLNAIEHLSVPEMPFYQAVWLMNNFSQLDALDFKKKKKIYKAIGGHPWTIGMFAHHVTTATVDGLLLELEPLEKELKDFTLFDKSYSELDEAARELLIKASVFEEAVSVEALRWMMGDAEKPSPAVDEPLMMLLDWGLMSRREEQDETQYLVHTKLRDFVGREDGERQKLQIRAAQFYELKVKDSHNIWDHLKARDYYYLAEEWEKAADIANNTVMHLSRWGYVELAINLLSQSIETAPDAKKCKAKANLAVLYHNLGDWKAALKILVEVKEIFEMEGDTVSLAAILNNLGIVCFKQGNCLEAIEYYQQSLDLAKSSGNQKGIAGSLHQLGMVYHQHGNYPKAFKCYKESLDISVDINDKWGMAMTMRQIGVAHVDKGDYPNAMDYFKKSLKIFSELEDKKNISMTLHSLGNIFLMQGNYSDAIELSQQCLEGFKKLGDQYGLSAVLHQLSIIHEIQENYPEAIKCCQQRLQICIELGDKFGIGRCLRQLGVILRKQNKLIEAIDIQNKSIKIKEELDDKKGISESLYELGTIYQQQGKYLEATNFYTQSLNLAEELGDKVGIAASSHQLGTIEEENKDYEKSLRKYVIARSILKELHNPDQEIAQSSINRLKCLMGDDAFKETMARLGKDPYEP